MRHPATIALLAAFLGSCALVEPTSRSRILANRGKSADAIFSCAEAAIKSLQADRGNWVTGITTQNAKSGIFETGNFNEFNRVGIRTQITYTAETGEVAINIKASGPYFTDLGAQQAAELLAERMSKCL